MANFSGLEPKSNYLGGDLTNGGTFDTGDEVDTNEDALRISLAELPPRQRPANGQSKNGKPVFGRKPGSPNLVELDD